MSNEQSKNSNQSNENCRILTNKRKKEKKVGVEYKILCSVCLKP